MAVSRKEFDVIVVGSGPGGATVAKDLALKGQNVLILEWGDNDPVKGTLAQFVKNCAVPGKGLFITSNLLGMLRGITTGGSSMFYCGTVKEPAYAMFNELGVDITREAAEIRGEVPNEILPDELMSPAGKLFLKSATELGYDCNRLEKFVFQDKCRSNCTLCDYGCPYGAMWNARKFVDVATENGATLITKAKVSKVIVEKRKAIGVEYKQNNELLRAYAGKIVIAAGGIGSPLILRESGIQGVGYDFFCDPLIYVIGKIPGLNQGKGIPMSSGLYLEEEGILLTDFNMPHMMKMLFDLEKLKIKQAMNYNSSLPIMIKIRDELGGHLTKRGWSAKRLSKNDKVKLKKGVGHATRILENLGATDIYQTMPMAAHPGGTVKIGEFVDADLKTRFDNLYVCDASVIPGELGMPPVLTILSLGRRLSKHLLALD